MGLTLMRFVFRKSVPQVRRVLIVESGPRSLTERFLPVLAKVLGQHVRADLFTCLPPPQPGERAATANGIGFAECYRSQDYGGRAARRQLVRKFKANGYECMVMLCANSPLLFRWKWALALQLPVKVLVANENADCYWLDIGHWRTAKAMVAERYGLRGAGSLQTLGQAFLFPFVLVYLLAFAILVHTRRGLRLLLGWRPASRVS